jgi:hypothetical protein
MNNRIPGAKKYFYNVIVDGDVMLLLQHRGKFTNKKDKTEIAYGIIPISGYEGKFEKFEDFYFVINNKLVLVSTKKSFIKSLGPYSHSTKAFLDEYKLDLTNKQDIITLAKLLNRIGELEK